MKASLKTISKDIRACTHCEANLPLGANPIFQAASKARILIAAQAPGIRVHESSIPFNDPSGDRLREWLNVDRDCFYDPDQFAIIPMGFCYPGTGKHGDLPPRRECAQLWHEDLLALLPAIRLKLVIGQYAQQYYLGKRAKKNLTETVRHWQDFQPECLPLPHPSPRNNIWLKKNPWFAEDLIPVLQNRIATLLG